MIAINAVLESKHALGQGYAGKGTTSSRAAKSIRKNSALAPEVTPRAAVLLFFFCLFGWLLAGAQAVAGPICGDKKYCPYITHVDGNASWARFCNRVPESTEGSPVVESLSLIGSGGYFLRTNHKLRPLRMMPSGQDVDLFPMDHNEKPQFDWRCRHLVPRLNY